MSTRPSPGNRFLHRPPGKVFAANALPMMLIMLMNGLLNIIDAAFLGHFVGTDAMTAIGLVFPAVMVLTALSAHLVSGGMSSLLARQLGAGDTEGAGQTAARAHGLAFAIAAIVMLVFFCGGRSVADRLSASDPQIAGMAFTYMAITVFAAPIQFALSLHADIWRNEGRAGLVALLSVGVTLANIGLNYVLIGEMGFGVAGSAWGTVLAQAFGLILLLWLRGRGQGNVPLQALSPSALDRRLAHHRRASRTAQPELHRDCACLVLCDPRAAIDSRCGLRRHDCRLWHRDPGAGVCLPAQHGLRAGSAEHRRKQLGRRLV